MKTFNNFALAKQAFYALAFFFLSSSFAFGQWSGTNPEWVNHDVEIGYDGIGFGLNGPNELRLNGSFKMERNEGGYHNHNMNMVISSRGTGPAGLRIQGSQNDGGSYEDLMHIATNGQVGIGTAEPIASRLQLNGDGNALFIEREGFGGAYVNTLAKIGISASSSLPGLRFMMSDDDANSFTDALFLSQDGKVGINNPNPQADLEVVGEIRAKNSNFLRYVSILHNGANGSIESNPGKLHLNYTSNNDVAIGDVSNTTSPAKLTVAGDVMIGYYCPPGAGYATSDLRVSGDIYNEGFIHTTEVEVKSSWCDYVFEDSYTLNSLKDVKAFINENGHLPNIPSAREVEEEGLKMADMQRRMMEKIEELTLYVIQLNDQVEQLEQDNLSLQTQISNH